MAENNRNASLSRVRGLFSGSARNDEAYDHIFASDNRENVVRLSVTELDEYKDHPFSVKDDEDMAELVESVKAHGVINPILVRPKGARYEILSGHRRVFAAKRAGVGKVPAIVRAVDDAEAAIDMTESNLYRTEILPSEWAAACKRCVEEGKGIRGTARELGITKESVSRYVSLANLEPSLMAAVDQKKMPVAAAVAVSNAVSKENQKVIAGVCEDLGKWPNMKQSNELVDFGGTTMYPEEVTEIMVPVKEPRKPKKRKITLDSSWLDDFFPPEMDVDDIYSLITRWAESWRDNDKE